MPFRRCSARLCTTGGSEYNVILKCWFLSLLSLVSFAAQLGFLFFRLFLFSLFRISCYFFHSPIFLLHFFVALNVILFFSFLQLYIFSFVNGSLFLAILLASALLNWCITQLTERIVQFYRLEMGILDFGFYSGQQRKRTEYTADICDFRFAEWNPPTCSMELNFSVCVCGYFIPKMSSECTD